MNSKAPWGVRLAALSLTTIASYKVFVSGDWPVQAVHCSKDPAISVQTQVMEREGGTDGSAVLYRTGSR